MPDKRLLAKIHIAKKDLNLSDEVYRDVLREQLSVESSAGISNDQAIKLLNHFHSLGWVSNTNTHTNTDLGRPRRDPYAASGAIKRKIEAMWHDIYKGTTETRHLRHWLFNKFRVNDVEFLDRRTAWQAVEALKAMKKRGIGHRPTQTDTDFSSADVAEEKGLS